MEEFRMQYPLSKDSLVLDAGAYRGDFIDWCLKKWGCKVIAFEPSVRFYEGVRARFYDPRVQVFNYGLSDFDDRLILSLRGDSTSVHFGELDGLKEVVQIRDVKEVFDELGLTSVDLFKINIEGGEYQVMPRILRSGLVERVKYFQIQYHDLGATDPKKARERIREELNKTHVEEWCVNDGQWESWMRRELT